MDMQARKQELEQTMKQAQEQIGEWTKKLWWAQAQHALLVELDAKKPRYVGPNVSVVNGEDKSAIASAALGSVNAY